MYEFDHHDNDPTLESADAFQNDMDRWRAWAARETQLRALLGHYILDGHISQYTGGPTCQKHTTSTLHLPASNEIFAASTSEQWKIKMRLEPLRHLPLWQVFSFTFSAHFPTKHLGTFRSALEAALILEGINSLIADAHVGPVTVVGSPSRKEITYALCRFHTQLSLSEALIAVEKLQIELRWHAVIIDTAIDFNRFCRKLCDKYKVRQSIFRRRREAKGFDLESWACSVTGRQSLLSAIAIHDTLSSVPLGITPSTHLAASLFMGAVVYCGMLLSGMRTVSVPQHPDYESILMLHNENGNLLHTVTDDGDLNFLRGAAVPQGVLKNLRYDINLFSMSLKNIANVWGVSAEMHQILHELLSAVNLAET